MTGATTTAAAARARVPMPRFWLALPLLVWGSLTDNLAGACVMAALLEGIGAAPIRWAMAEREFHRAADLTSVVFALVTIMQFSRYSVHGIYQILNAMPYCLFPLVLAQRASTLQSIPLSALFYSLRREARFDERIDIAPHYAVVCLLAASTTGERSLLFAGAAALVCAGLIGATRPARYRWWQWIAALAIALALAGAGQVGVLRAQRFLEASVMYWLNQFPWTPGDPNKAVTAIGAIGRLKLSDQIRLRVTPGRGVTLPLFLQEASYDTFKYGTWTATTAEFAAIDKLAGRDAWTVAPAGVRAHHPVELTFQHRRELALLPVPRGTREVRSGEIAELQRNRFGALMAESPPGALRYTVASGEPLATEPPPTPADLVVPREYAKLIEVVGRELALDGHDTRTRAARIQQFFLDHFKYSLIQHGSAPWRTPLAYFLTRSRRGHCEYFASASVLLLRAAGIPARYAVGYVVEEYSTLERAYIARARHAHAWALAYVDGAWIMVDSTPAVWFELENDIASRWQILNDLAAWLTYRYQRLTNADFGAATDFMIWLVPPLAIVLYVRLRRSPTAVRQDAARARLSAQAGETLMTPVIDGLGAHGLEPRRGETLVHFLTRAAPASGGGVERDSLVARYYRLRFAPDALDEAARAALQEEALRYSAALADRSR